MVLASASMIEVAKPFPTVALPRVWRWIEAVRDRIADDYFATTLDTFVDDWLALENGGQRITWAVKRDGAVGGVITSTWLTPVIRDFHIVMQKDFWGRETTLPAIEAVLEEIFLPKEEGGCGALKLSTLMFASNHSAATLLRVFGVKREGLLHGHTLRGGKPVDLAMLGLQREAFYVIRDQRRRKQQHIAVESGGVSTIQPGDQHDEQRNNVDQPNRSDERHDDGRIGHDAKPDTGAIADRADTVQADPAISDKSGLDHSASAESGAWPG